MSTNHSNSYKLITTGEQRLGTIRIPSRPDIAVLPSFKMFTCWRNQLTLIARECLSVSFMRIVPEHSYFYPRRDQIPGFYPYPKARSGNASKKFERCMGFTNLTVTTDRRKIRMPKSHRSKFTVLRRKRPTIMTITVRKPEICTA